MSKSETEHRLLLRPPFRRLLGAWAFSNFGDTAVYLTLAMWARDLTNSNAVPGLVFLAFNLPNLLSPLFGLLADRVSRRRMVMLSNAMGAAVLLLLLFVHTRSDIWLLFAVTVLYGSLGPIVAAAQPGLLVDLVRDHELPAANSALTTVDMGLRLGAPLAGAGLYALGGGHAIALLTAVMLVLSSLLLGRLRMTEFPPTPKLDRMSPRRELLAGLGHIGRTPVLLRMTICLAIAVGTTGVLSSTNFAMLEVGLGLPTEFIGVLASLQGTGAVIGSAAAQLMIRRRGERATVGYGLVLVGLGIASTATGSLAVVLAGMVSIGLGLGSLIVGYTVLRQRLTPPGLQGRTGAAANMALMGPQMIMAGVGAGPVAQFDYRVIVASVALTILVSAAALTGRSERARRTTANV